MSETKFTPGPWVFGPFCKADESDSKCRMFAVGLGVDQQTGLSGIRPEGVGDYMLLSGICKREDAALMAAAPLLYEELENAIKNLEYTEGESGAMDADLKRFRLALSKARGESQ